MSLKIYLNFLIIKELTVTRWGTLKINYKNMMTSIEGVFAAGDIVRGASLVVWGIKDGRDAAKNIQEYIEFKAIFRIIERKRKLLMPNRFIEKYKKNKKFLEKIIYMTKKMNIHHVVLD